MIVKLDQKRDGERLYAVKIAGKPLQICKQSELVGVGS